MQKLLLSALFLCAVLGTAACSAPADDEGGKGRIEEFTDEVAGDATGAIRRPLDKARNMQDLARQRNEEIPQE